MTVVRKLLDAVNIVSGLAAVGGVLGWVAAVIWRFLLRRSVPFADWVVNGAGIFGVLGLAAAIVYVLS